MMRAVIPKATLQRIIVQASIVSNNDLNLEYQPEGWLIEGVDAAHVAMIRMSVDRKAMDEYELNSESDADRYTQISLRKLSEALSTITEDGSVSITDDGAFVCVDCGRMHRKIRKEGEYGPDRKPRNPKLDLACSVMFDTNEIYAMMKKGSSISDHIIITCGPDGLKISLVGDTESASYENPDIVTDDGQTYTSMFPLDYICDALNGFRGEVVMELDTNYPLKLMTMDPFVSVYLLAPRVEEGEDVE